MLTLTRPQRQALATLAVLAGSVAPTLYVGSLAWRVNRPGHVRDVEVELGRALGVQVTLEGVRYPRPNEAVYLGAVFRQEEPGRKNVLTELARADAVRIRRAGGDVGVEFAGLKVRAESPRQALAHLAALMQRAGVGGGFERIGMTAPQVDIDLGDESLRYRVQDVVSSFAQPGGSASNTAPTALVSFRVVGPGGVTRCELALTRDRTRSGMRTTLAARTAEGPPLPGFYLNPFFTSAEWLGPTARAEGSITLTQEGTAPEWSAEVQGALHDVDLASLVTGRFVDHRLTGRATLLVESARWGNRPGQGFGWVEARGRLEAGPGAVGASLLDALNTEMRFRVGRKPAGADIEFARLGLDFVIGSDGQIQVGGALGDEFAPGVVLVGANHVTPLAYAPEGAANVRGLIKTLIPIRTADVLVPSVPESQILQRFLPVPAGEAPKPIVGN